MTIQLLFFGRAKDIAGARSIHMDVPDNASVSTLRALLSERYAALDTGLQYAVAINEVYAENHRLIQSGDVVAILPPVSGG